ncbi:hypothetical protein Nepgr_011748 [Nepenthes gracilis]|uniref:Phthiocerol/phthiodiolone dimycocerosyl transferase C-terminal domain-containing protein n=1 Tax=Nepenthes gracilis TaxID=150966 RepID=A0AAD3SEX9_NEPGR|nr:hypothetical protein Nepgr_011748 [Nepenthes gracilis]
MSDSGQPEFSARPVADTELSWCMSVPGGTGVTVIGLLLTKPADINVLQSAIHKLQKSHPITRSKLHYDPTTEYLLFPHATNPSTPPTINHHSLSPFHRLLEHESNQNPWSSNPDSSSSPPDADTDVFHASVYTLDGPKWAVMLKLHTATCDRRAAVSMLRELVVLIRRRESEGDGVELGMEENGEVSLGIEECIPSGKASKPFWARGIDILGYSLNSFRLANMDFVDADSPRYSEMVRLQMNLEETSRLLEVSRSQEIKLCGALAAAGLMAVRTLKDLPNGQWEKYSVTTLLDCREILEPALSSHHVGFYHSAIINSHDMKGEEQLWELARRTYNSFRDAKNGNKHFSSMADLNFLMRRAIENPGLTPSSSLRTSFISVFENPLVIEIADDESEELGLEDFVAYASVHGVGPSIAIFDLIKNGRLNCACMYPAPLHSREQMQELVDHMKRILLDGCSS